MFRTLVMMCLFFACLDDCAAQEQSSASRTNFRIRYVAAGSVYIEGGRNAGLTEGMKLVIKQSTQKDSAGKPDPALEPGVVAKLTVISVAATSAVCDVIAASRELAVGDMVSLPQVEIEQIAEKHALGNTRQYPAVVSFTEGDPLDEDVREVLPKPPLPEVNMARGRIGFDYSTIRSGGNLQSVSSQTGLVLRADITRILGSHWNLNGYWRGRLQSSSSTSRPTIQDLLNRTYTLGLTYINPESNWTMGVGRLYLPWASSLDTIDGGYIGLKVGGPVLLGVFGGSTPDPTAWNYDPNREIAGAFLNVQGGNYESVRLSTTAGAGLEMLKWRTDRPFVFTDSSLSYKRVLAIYHSMQIDRPTANPGSAPVPAGLGRSFLSLRISPHPRVTFDLNDTYFRDVPTYDPQLIGTGLLDKYLFQGISGGVRVELPAHLSLYANLGNSSNSGDAKNSGNYMAGITMGRLWRTGLRVDARYSKFDSSFAQGTYRTLSFSRNIGDALHWQMDLGDQSYTSSLAKDNGAFFVNSFFDVTFGARYFIESGFTLQRGGTQDYDQWTTTLGYRFDNRRRKKEAASAPQP